MKLETLLEQSQLRTAPDQIWMSIRLVPLLAETVYNDVHLVSEAPKEGSLAYLPHGLVLQNQVAQRTQMGAPKQKQWDTFQWGYLEHNVKKQGQQLHFLPQHLAISSYLATHFGAPDIYWKDFYNRRCLRDGVGSQELDVLSGDYFYGLEEALRQFEIYDNQVGMLLFIDDVLANVVIYPHPADYRRLHSLLLQDYYGQDLFWAACHCRQLPLLLPPDAKNLQNLEQLALALRAHEMQITQFHEYMTANLFQQELTIQQLYRYKTYDLQSFISPIELGQAAFAGEMIVSPERLAYLHVFRLDLQQVKDAWYYQHLQRHQWDPVAAAEALHLTLYAFVRKLAKTSLANMIQGPWLQQAEKDHRTRLAK